MANHERTGAETLRLIVRNIGDCRESFNDRFTLDELIKIHLMFLECGWDIYPDQWEERQIKEALERKIPKWDSMERPFYDE